MLTVNFWVWCDEIGTEISHANSTINQINKSNDNIQTVGAAFGAKKMTVGNPPKEITLGIWVPTPFNTIPNK